jgi:hypothetical protein
MASIKAMKFEKDMLNLAARAKELVLTYIEDPGGRMALQEAINEIYDRAHAEQRNLRKSLAYFHNKEEGKDVSGFGASVQEIVDAKEKATS